MGLYPISLQPFNLSYLAVQVSHLGISSGNNGPAAVGRNGRCPRLLLLKGPKGLGADSLLAAQVQR